MMNLKRSRVLLPLVVLLLVASSGCTSAPAPAPQAAAPAPADTVTTLPAATLVTRVPADEVARIRVELFGMNPDTETIYEFLGTVQTENGVYRSVQVVLRYPDGQEYGYDAGGMGGANQTLKSFYLYPADRYRGTDPEKIIVLDGKRYRTVYRLEDGVVSWIAMSDTPVSP